MKLNTVRLRVAIGALGMALPWIVLILSLVFGYGFPASISATYYLAECITPFMIILGAASICLIAYRGYNRIDDILLTIAGLSGMAICLFPCATTLVAFAGTFHVPVAISGIIHNVSAFIFFGLLSYNSLFLFTKGEGELTQKKKIRNIIYRICGIGMLASFLLLLLPAFPIQVWLVEAIALTFFGISFLTKADAFPFLFCDTSYEEGDD